MGRTGPRFSFVEIPSFAAGFASSHPLAPPAPLPARIKADQDRCQRVFMEGRHDQLVEAALQLMNYDSHVDRAAFDRAIIFLLFNQFVRSPDLPGYTFRVVRGTGMGLPGSGEISDCCLLQRAELEFVYNLDQRVGIEFYARYRNDIFMIVSGTRQQFSRWFQGFKLAAAPFRLVVETVSQREVPMLDINISLGVDGCICTSHYIKPSAQKVWLDDSSGHPLSVHKYWPLVQCHRIGSLCSSVEARTAGIIRFIKSLEEQCPDHIALDACWKVVRPAPRPARRVAAESSWIVLPYSECTAASGISNLLKSFSTLLAALGVAPPRISWSLASRPLFLELRRLIHNG